MATRLECFKHDYQKWLDKTSEFRNLRPLRHFVHGLLCCSEDEVEETLELMRIVENDLLDKGLVAFKVEAYEDVNRINPNTDAGFIQWCIWSLISRMPYKASVLFPDEFDRQEFQLFEQGDPEALAEFYRTHSILYADPMPLKDIEQLKEMHLPEVPDSENEMPFEDLFDLK